MSLKYGKAILALPYLASLFDQLQAQNIGLKIGMKLYHFMENLSPMLEVFHNYKYF